MDGDGYRNKNFSTLLPQRQASLTEDRSLTEQRTGGEGDRNVARAKLVVKKKDDVASTHKLEGEEDTNTTNSFTLVYEQR